jgi:hypothetical protein
MALGRNPLRWMVAWQLHPIRGGFVPSIWWVCVSRHVVGLTKCAFSWKVSQRVQVLGAEGEQASLLEVLDLHPQRIDHCRSHLASPGRTVDRRELLRFRLELREVFLAVPVLLVVADHTFTSSLAVPQRARPARVPRGRRGRIARRADRIPAP